MNTPRLLTVSLAWLLFAAGARAQTAAVVSAAPPGAAFAGTKVDIVESVAVEAISPTRNAPFSAEAVTEFTQTLGDGNRIERRYASFVARDSRGRTRRQEEIALVGALAVNGPAPTLVTIQDPEAGVSFTLDESQRVAYRNRMGGKLAMLWSHAVASTPPPGAAEVPDAKRAEREAMIGTIVASGARQVTMAPVRKRPADWTGGASTVVTEALGTRTIDGVLAEGTRTTSTIAAGAIGNVLPIEVVSERWFSPELQEPVLITRSDPRSGESTYRLTSIVRTEPPQDLFTVPPDFEVRDGALTGLRMLKKF